MLVVANWFNPTPRADRQLLIATIIALTGIEYALRTRLGREGMIAWRRRALLLLFTAAFALVAAEAATRVIFRHVTTSADTGSFFSRRWLNDVRFNAQGFRAPEVDATKDADRYRIAVIGDSFTFGNGLTEDERYSNRLAAWLGDRYEVLNFGTGGANTPYHLEVLRKHVLPASPDFVLLQWYVNDIEGDDTSGRPQPSTLLPRRWHPWLNRRSALYVLANMRWAELQIGFGWYRSYADYLAARARDPDSQDARRDSALLRDFIETARAQKVPVGMVLFPDTGAPLDAHYPYAFLHDRVLRICQEAGIHCLDLRRDFAAEKDRRSLWVSPFDHHPSAHANELAARKLLETFGKDWSSR